jgi:hypothetical protein
MNYSEACSENIKRANKELSMWNDLDGITSLGWKRIPIVAKDINDHEHPDIKTNTFYLVCDDGVWFMGKFTRNYWNTGWEIYKGYRRSLGSLSMIYELSGIPEIPKELIPRVDIKTREVEVSAYEEEEYGCECNHDVCTCYKD